MSVRVSHVSCAFFFVDSVEDDKNLLIPVICMTSDTVQGLSHGIALSLILVEIGLFGCPDRLLICVVEEVPTETTQSRDEASEDTDVFGASARSMNLKYVRPFYFPPALIMGVLEFVSKPAAFLYRKL